MHKIFGQLIKIKEYRLREDILPFQALNFISKINTTFRTNTDMHFGPKIIECGLNIGKYMYQTLNQMENYA
ncbi:hypothetical protein [Desulfonauticus submarinus]